jgi:hypothetical protein
MVDREGTPLGRIMHIYLDEVTGEPEWALVAGQGSRQVFVPLVDAAEQEHQIRVPVERARISDAPVIRPGRQLSKEDTARLHGHYGGAPELRWGSSRRMPAGGPAARLRQGLDWARERVPSPAAVGSPRTRRLLAAAAAAAAASVAGGLLVVQRRRRARPSGLAAAIGRAVGSVLAVPAGALRRRRRRRRLRALAGTATVPFAAAGRAVARAGRGVPAPTRTPHRRSLRSRRRRMAGNLKLLAGLAAGYVLGARAGRERYEQIAEATRRLAERPEVRELTGNLRSRLGASLEKAAGTASERLQQARGEDRPPEDQDRTAAGGPASTRRPVPGTGQAPLAEAGPAAGQDHGGTGSPPSQAGEAEAGGRAGDGPSPEKPAPSRTGRDRSRSGR